MGLGSRGGQCLRGGGGGMGYRDGQRLKIGLSVISLPEESDNRRAASFITRSN